MKRLLSHPDLNEHQAIQLAMGWVEDRRNDLGMDTDDFHIVPAKAETISSIMVDPALRQALGVIGEIAVKDKSVHNMVMAIWDAVA